MTLKSYLTIMILATFVCWSAFSFVLWTVNPDITNWLGFLLFYLSLFFALNGTASIIGFVIRFIGLKHELAFYSVKSAFRQSFLFSFFIISIFYLLSRDLFTWLNLFLLIIGLSLLEFFLISYGSRNVKRATHNPEYEKENIDL